MIGIIFLATFLQTAFGDVTPQNILLCQQYSGNEYYDPQTYTDASITDCSLACTTSNVETVSGSYNGYDGYNGYNSYNEYLTSPPDGPINDGFATYTGNITRYSTNYYSLANLETCGTQQVCITGTCTPINPDLQDECVVNFGDGAVSVQPANECQISCMLPAPADDQYYSYDTNIPNIMMLPEQAPCKGGLCAQGNCLLKSHFPAC